MSAKTPDPYDLNLPLLSPSLTRTNNVGHKISHKKSRASYAYAATLLASITLSAGITGCSTSTVRAPDDSPSLGSLTSAKERLTGSAEASELPPLKEKSADELRADAIQNYRDFIAVAPDSQEKTEATRRLADLQLETDATRGGGIRDSAALYQSLLDANPNNPSNDLIYYQLAKAYIFDENPEMAVATLAKLAKRFPNSPIRAEADFRRAEILFQYGNYAEAEKAYRTVLKVASAPNAPSRLNSVEQKQRFLDQAQYKLGWALFKQKRYNDALDELHIVLDRKLPKTADNRVIDIDLSALSRPEQELINDALRATSLSFYYKERRGQGIGDYLKTRPQRHYESLLFARLAELYTKKEQYPEAARTWGGFPDRNPLHRQAPLFSDKVIESWETGGYLSEVLKEKAKFVERYDLNAAYWQHFDSNEAPDIIARVKKHLVDLAEHYHAQALDPEVGNSTDNFRQAINWYGRYLGNFPADELAPKQNFLLAEAHQSLGEYEIAGREFERTAYNYPPHERTTEAGYASVLAYQKGAERFAEGSPEFEPAQRKYIAAGLTFAEKFPNAEQTPVVLTKAAEDLYKLDDYDSAINTAGILLQRQPPASSDLRLSAWTTTARARYETNQYAAAEQAYNEALQITGVNPTDLTLQAELTSGLAYSIYKQGEAHLEVKETREAIDDFQRLGKIVPDSELRPKAEYQAAAALIQLEDWPNAAIALAGFRDNYPNDALAREATIKLAEVYEKSNQPGKAAGEYLRVAGFTEETAEVREAAALKSAELYMSIDAKEPAIDSWQAYLQLLPQDVLQTIEIRQKIIETHLALGNISQANFWRGELLTAEQSIGSRSTERTRFLAADAALQIGEINMMEFQAAKISEPLAETAELKKALLQDVVNAYTIAAEYELADVTTQATHRLGQAYHEFAEALMKSPRPANLAGEELEEYNLLLEEESAPFEEKAIDLYVANLKRAEQDLANEWVQASYTALTKLAPGLYGKNERTERVYEDLQ